MLSQDLQTAFSKPNLNRAWRWIISSPEPAFKNYFRDVYNAFSISDTQSIDLLHERLIHRTFEANHAAKIYLPKSNGLLRPISLLSIEDQIVYQAFVNVIADRLYPIKKPYYYKNTFGHLYAGRRSAFFYRSWKVGYREFSKAVEEAIDIDKRNNAASFDLTAFYDTIDHKVLTYYLKKIGLDKDFCKQLVRFLTIWTATDHQERIYQGHGIPQGPLSSGMLSEVILHCFDEELSAVPGLSYHRYVDDVRIYAGSENEIRSALIKADLVSKKLGLFPQGAKIEIREVVDADDEFKSVSRLSDDGEFLQQSGSQGKSKARSKTRSGFDETSFKYSLNRAKFEPQKCKSLVGVLTKRPHLFDTILRHFEKRDKHTDANARILLEYLKSRPIYQSITAKLLNTMRTRLSIPLYKEYSAEVYKLFSSEWHTSTPDLQAAIACWLIPSSLLTNDQVLEIITASHEWWVRKESIRAISPSYIGRLYVDQLVNYSLSDGIVDVSLVAAHLSGRLNGFRLTTRPGKIHLVTQEALKSLGLMKRRTGQICGIEYGLKKMLRSVFSKRWSRILGSKYILAERMITLANGYSKTDMNACVHAIDHFHEYVLEELISHDNTIGNHPGKGNIGGFIGGTTSKFARKYPKLNAAMDCIHEAVKASDLKHPYVKKTGAPTGRIEFEFLKDTARPLLIQGYKELHDLW